MDCYLFATFSSWKSNCDVIQLNIREKVTVSASSWVQSRNIMSTGIEFKFRVLFLIRLV